MKIEMKKFGEILTSRTDGKEAGMAAKAYLRPKGHEKIELDFKDVLAVGPSWLDEFLSILKEGYGVDRIHCLPSDNASVIESLKTIELQRGKKK